MERFIGIETGHSNATHLKNVWKVTVIRTENESIESVGCIAWGEGLIVGTRRTGEFRCCGKWEVHRPRFFFITLMLKKKEQVLQLKMEVFTS